MIFRAVSLLILSALVTAQAAAPYGSHFSANEQYSVELSLTPENQVLVAVFKQVKSAKTLLWSRPVDWEEIYPGSLRSSGMLEIKTLVTNDGNTVLLRDYNAPERKNGLKILRRAEVRALNPFARRELTAAAPLEMFANRTPLRMGVSYLHVGTLLDLILEDQTAYALWFGQTDRWLLISLDNFQETVVQDPATIARLNEAGHRKAEQLVLEHQPPPLRRMVVAARQQLARYFPSLAPPFSSPYLNEETTAAYLFLTARHLSRDKAYVENLLQYKPEGIQRSFMNRQALNLTFSAGRSDRLVGDYLLARWNREAIHPDIVTRETDLLLAHDFACYLGTILVDFQVPVPVSATNSGNFWAYLIPAHLSGSRWTNSEEVIAFRGTPGFVFPGSPHPEPLGRAGQAAFRELTPGAYCVKMIWERQGTSSAWTTNRYFGASGDYESLVTEPITVRAGAISTTTLTCTNRLGPANAYSADDQWIENIFAETPKKQPE